MGRTLQDRYRRAASYIVKIVRGANPADLPVEQSAKFALVVNLTTAKALGLTIPQPLLLFDLLTVRFLEVRPAGAGRADVGAVSRQLTFAPKSRVTVLRERP